MAKVKKYQLELEEGYDFDLIGISSHHNDYRLAWSINSELNLALELSSEPYIISTNKKGVILRSEFPMYEFHDEENHLDYYLIKNKSNGKFLISERQSIDYFMFICERGMVDMDEFAVKLRNVTSVLAVFPFEAEELDSCEKLVFN